MLRRLFNATVRDARPAAGVAEPLAPRAGPGRLWLTRAGWWLGEQLGGVWWVLALDGWAIVAAPALAPGAARRRALPLVLVGAAAALATAATHGGTPRYSLELLPLTVLATAVGTAAIVRAVAAGARAARA